MKKHVTTIVIGCVAVMMFISVYGVSASSYETVSDSSAANLRGGTDKNCKDAWVGTCGDQEDPPDPECEAVTCMTTTEGEGDPVAEDQEGSTLAVCGDFDCGTVATTNPCDE